MAFSTQNRKEFPNQAATFTKDGNTKLTNEDVAGLLYCTDLVYLDLTGNKLSDLSFVKNLTKLRLLCVGNNKIADITALSSLTELEFLEVYSNPIVDYKPIAGLAKLTHLNCTRTGITDNHHIQRHEAAQNALADEHKITKEDLAKLAGALPECTITSHGTNPLSADWHKAELYHTFEILSGLVAPDSTPTPEPSITPDPAATTPEPSPTTTAEE